MLKDFENKLFSLTIENIREMAKEENGNIGNVIRGLHKECFGISSESVTCEKLSFFYINYDYEVPGYTFEITLSEKDFYNYLLSFSVFLTKHYDFNEPIGIYNTFINYLRSALEQNNIITISSTELKKYETKKLELLSFSKIEIVKIFETEKFYKDWMNSTGFIIEENTNYLYLMLNKDTGYFKIGYSKNPEYREKTLQSREPQIFLIKAWKCEKEIEKLMHLKFKKKRIRGEWFKLDINDLNILEKTLANTG